MSVGVSLWYCGRHLVAGPTSIDVETIRCVSKKSDDWMRRCKCAVQESAPGERVLVRPSEPLIELVWSHLGRPEYDMLRVVLLPFLVQYSSLSFEVRECRCARIRCVDGESGYIYAKITYCVHRVGEVGAQDAPAGLAASSLKLAGDNGY